MKKIQPQMKKIQVIEEKGIDLVQLQEDELRDKLDDNFVELILRQSRRNIEQTLPKEEYLQRKKLIELSSIPIAPSLIINQPNLWVPIVERVGGKVSTTDMERNPSTTDTERNLSTTDTERNPSTKDSVIYFDQPIYYLDARDNHSDGGNNHRLKVLAQGDKIAIQRLVKMKVGDFRGVNSRYHNAETFLLSGRYSIEDIHDTWSRILPRQTPSLLEEQLYRQNIPGAYYVLSWHRLALALTENASRLALVDSSRGLQSKSTAVTRYPFLREIPHYGFTFSELDFAMLNDLQLTRIVGVMTGMKLDIRSEIEALKTKHRIELSNRAEVDRQNKLLADNMQVDRILRKILSSSKYNDIRSKLDDTIEYIGQLPDAVRKKVEVQTGSACDHGRLAQKLRRGDDRALSQIKSLKNVCPKCGGQIVCPHVIDFYSYTEHRIRRSKMQKYEEDGHCRLCGEVFPRMIFETSLIPYENQDEELAKYIWGNVAAHQRFIDLSPSLDERKFITLVRDGIYAQISEIEARIMKNRTLTKAKFEARMAVYTSVHIFAYMIHLQQKHPKTLQWKLDNASRASRGDKNAAKAAKTKHKGDKQSLVQLLAAVIKIIQSTKMRYLREDPSITVDLIKTSLIEAFKQIQQGSIDAPEERSPLDTDIRLDPIWNAISRVYSVESTGKQSKHSDGTQTSKKGKQSKQSGNGKQGKQSAQLESMVMSNLEKNRRLYDDVREIPVSMPKIPQISLNTASQMTQTIERNMTLLGFNQMLQTVRTGDVSKELYQLSERYAMLKKTFQSMYFRPKFVSSRNVTNIPRVDISRVYDESGREHKWSLYVTKKYAEIKKEEFKGLLAKNGSLPEIIDMKCAICGVLKSETHTLDVEKISSSLYVLSRIDNFSKYYAQRCPLGDMHRGEKICEKCGMHRDNSNVKLMYKKYEAKYIEDKKSQLEIQNTVAVKPATHSYEWSQSFQPIAELARRLKVSESTLLSIGLREGMTEHVIPEPAENRYNAQSYVLQAYTIMTYMEWNQIRLFYGDIRPNTALGEILKDTSLDSLQGANLPDIYDDYMKKYYYFQWKLSPVEMVAWCTQSLCEKLLAVAIVDNPVAHKFFTYITNRILRAEELREKPGYFSYSQAFGDTTTKIEEAVEAKEDDEGEEQLFSLDGYDVEDVEDIDFTS